MSARCMQRLLIPVCITEAMHLMGILQDLTKWRSSSHGGRPLMALSALLCLRRRIRSMVLSQQMMQMTWQAGGDECGHLGQTAHMLRSLDRIIYTSEELLTRRLVAIIDDTVARAYHDISWTRLRWAVTGCLPSAPLMHLRCVLHSLLHKSAPFPRIGWTCTNCAFNVASSAGPLQAYSNTVSCDG